MHVESWFKGKENLFVLAQSTDIDASQQSLGHVFHFFLFLHIEHTLDVIATSEQNVVFFIHDLK